MRWVIKEAVDVIVIALLFGIVLIAADMVRVILLGCT